MVQWLARWTSDLEVGGLSLVTAVTGGSSNIPSRFMLQKPELSAGLMYQLARMQTLPLFSEGLIIGRKFAFQNGLHLTIKTA